MSTTRETVLNDDESCVILDLFRQQKTKPSDGSYATESDNQAQLKMLSKAVQEPVRTSNESTSPDKQANSCHVEDEQIDKIMSHIPLVNRFCTCAKTLAAIFMTADSLLFRR